MTCQARDEAYHCQYHLYYRHADFGIYCRLCFGQSISKLRIVEDAAVNKALTSWNTAIRHLPYIDIERGERYGDVVRRCLECPFDVRDKNMDNKTFQRAVFDSIVLPLREELENFMGVGIA